MHTWKPYTGPRSPASRCPSPRLERNSLLPFASQMCTPLAAKALLDVLPLTNLPGERVGQRHEREGQQHYC